MRIVATALVLALAIGSGAFARAPGAGPPLRYRTLTFDGWAGCVALEAGVYRVVVAPDIGGRIVDYSKSGSGPIWTNPAERGKLHPLDPKVWWNYGGYKTWPAPQSRWGWPPDPNLDAAPATVTPWRRNGKLAGLHIVGRKSPVSGVVFEKWIRLDPATGSLSLRQTMRALSGDPAPVRWGVWDITQVDAGGLIVIPLNPNGRHKNEGGVYFFSPDAKKSRQWRTADGLLLVRNHGDVTKYGADTNAGWMAWLRGRQAYIKRFPRMATGREYPDEYSSAQIYTNNPPLSYIEMEVTGPLATLEPGETSTLEEEWRLIELPKAVRTDGDGVEAIRYLMGRGDLEPLAPAVRMHGK